MQGTGADEERVLGPPIGALVRAGLIVPGTASDGASKGTLLEYARTLEPSELRELYSCDWCTASMVGGLMPAARQ